MNYLMLFLALLLSLSITAQEYQYVWDPNELNNLSAPRTDADLLGTLVFGVR